MDYHNSSEEPCPLWWDLASCFGSCLCSACCWWKGFVCVCLDSPDSCWALCKDSLSCVGLSGPLCLMSTGSQNTAGNWSRVTKNMSYIRFWGAPNRPGLPLSGGHLPSHMSWADTCVSLICFCHWPQTSKQVGTVAIVSAGFLMTIWARFRTER